MEINKVLKQGIELLGTRKYLNPNLDAVLLLSYQLDVDKVYIYTHMNQEISPKVVDKYFELIKKRKEGYPLNYIIKEKEFMGLNFYIEDGVLVPRPDTEILVESIIDMVKGKECINILDLGTGSGCIGLSLGYYIKKSLVYAVDIDDKALKIARENMKRFNLDSRVTILKGNLFEPIKSLHLEGEIDIIVSNPPYIPTKKINSLQIEVKQFEPKLALDGGKDGLNFYREIIPQSKKYLKSEGIIVFEIGYNQSDAIKQIFIEQGFNDVKIIKDLQGLDRVIVGKLS